MYPCYRLSHTLWTLSPEPLNLQWSCLIWSYSTIWPSTVWTRHLTPNHSPQGNQGQQREASSINQWDATASSLFHPDFFIHHVCPLLWSISFCTWVSLFTVQRCSWTPGGNPWALQRREGSLCHQLPDGKSSSRGSWSPACASFDLFVADLHKVFWFENWFRVSMED